MTWQRTLDIGHDGVTIRVHDGFVEMWIPDGDLLTPLAATELADVLKRAARFAGRERSLDAATRTRSA